MSEERKKLKRMNNNDKLHKGVEEIKQIHLTKSEKENMLEYILTGKKLTSAATVSDFIKRYHFVFSGTLASVLLLFTTTFAAERSLPGDALYPIKIGFTEQLQGAFIFTTEDELRWEAQKVDNRLTEAEELVKMGKFSATVEAQLNTQIENRLQKVNQIETKISGDKKANEPQKEKLLKEAAQTRRTIENRIFDTNQTLRAKVRSATFSATTSVQRKTPQEPQSRPERLPFKATSTTNVRATSSSAQFFRTIVVPSASSTASSTNIQRDDRSRESNERKNDSQIDDKPREMRLHIESNTQIKTEGRTRVEIPIKQNDADDRKIRVF